MANSNGWGDGASNNDIGWGQGADNAIGWGSIYADSWAGATDIVGTPAPSLLLDTYPNAAVAYSLRKLRTAYSGSAIRVRRSVDNAEQDIAFSGNDLDTASLLTFCGAGNGFITTWYDQSGNANNSTQATAANQAQIVSSGALISDPNTGKISVTWTSDSYSISNVAVTQNMLVSGVINRTATLTRLFLLGHTATPPRLVGVGNNGDIISQIGTGSVTHTNITTGAFIISGLRDSSNVVKAWTNTTALTTGTSTGTTGNFTRFGLQDATSTSGRIVEMVYWNNDKESSRANIVTNQNTYWNVY